MARYNKNFRVKALKLASILGRKQAAEKLGIAPATLSNWSKLALEELTSNLPSRPKKSQLNHNSAIPCCPTNPLDSITIPSKAALVSRIARLEAQVKELNQRICASYPLRGSYLND